MKKKRLVISIVLALLAIVISLVIVKSLSSCSKKANIEVIEVSDVVRFKSIENLNVKDYKGDNDVIIEIILNFENSDYKSSSNLSSNDYYIISKKDNSHISPLDLKVGDQLYFEYNRMLETSPLIAYGSYLYLC